MTLSSLAKGTRARIQRLPDGDIRSQCIRLGLSEGAVIECLERLPGGTVILQYCRQELALSTEVADVILVHPL